MAPKKVTQKRKEGSSSKAERATKKKPKIEATHYGSDSLVPPPPGFEKVLLRQWASVAIRSFKRSGAVAIPSMRAVQNSGVVSVKWEGKKPTEPTAVFTRTRSRNCLADSSVNETIRDVNLSPSSKNDDHEIAITDQLALALPDDSSAEKSEIPRPALSNSEKRNHSNLTRCPDEKIKNPTHSFNLTEMALCADCDVDEDEVEGPAMAIVAGCRLKDEFVETARMIVDIHGDILTECSFEGTTRTHWFQAVCFIYQKLEKAMLTDITLPELELMKKDIRDLLKANVSVGWLAIRLDEIYHAKQILQSTPLMKEQRDKHNRRILELEKNVQLREDNILEHEKEVKVLEQKILKHKEVLKFHEKIIQEDKMKLESERVAADKICQEYTKAKHAVVRFFKKSLVEGILS